MQTGRLRERVTIQQENVTRDASGQELKTWPDVATVWARVVSSARWMRFRR